MIYLKLYYSILKNIFFRSEKQKQKSLVLPQKAVSNCISSAVFFFYIKITFKLKWNI